jgi:Fe-S cluster assembly protein SufD
MSTSTVADVKFPAGFTPEIFEEFLTTRDEPDWVTARRREALEIFEAKLAEELDPEEWKRIELRAFRPDRFQLKPESESPPSSLSTMMQDRAEFGGAVVHVDGRCKHQNLSDDLQAKGVLFGDLATLLRDHGDIFKPHFGTKAVLPQTDRFSAWHAAFWTGGTVLYVPKNVTVDVPLYSLISLAQENATDLSHTLVVLESGAEATLLEETASATDEVGFHLGAVELLLGQEARLRYVQLQNWNGKSWHIAHQAGRIAKDAALQWTVAGLGAKLAHIHQDVHLDGPGADAQVNGVTFATDRQILSYYTQQTHHAPDTHSDLLYKDVLRDKSRVIWRGMIKVDKEAQKTDGYQRNDSLILTSTARCDAIPGLEIEADDVRCTHGATAGRVDVDQIFYAMCRGLSEYEAMHMIVRGFFQKVTDRIPVELVRETLDRAVEKKLGIGE